IERRIGRGGGGRARRPGDRHRDLGLAVVAGEPGRPRHPEADGRADQPRRGRADRAQPGHRRPADPDPPPPGKPADWKGGARAPRVCGGPPDKRRTPAREGHRGAGRGVPSDPADPENDRYYSPLSAAARNVMSTVIATISALGATIVRANIATASWIDDRA